MWSHCALQEWLGLEEELAEARRELSALQEEKEHNQLHSPDAAAGGQGQVRKGGGRRGAKVWAQRLADKVQGPGAP